MPTSIVFMNTSPRPGSKLIGIQFLPPNALGQTSMKSFISSVLRTAAVIGVSIGRPVFMSMPVAQLMLRANGVADSSLPD